MSTRFWSCLDGGTCHHECTSFCFRVVACGPLSEYGEDWPEDVKQFHILRMIEAQHQDPNAREAARKLLREGLSSDKYIELAAAVDMDGAMNISVDCENTKHKECDGRVHRGHLWVRCDCECHGEGIAAAIARHPSAMPPMKEELVDA